MPTITKYRLWCSNCQEWQLFNGKSFKDVGIEDIQICEYCSHQHVPTLIGDIPEDKVVQQRFRYRKAGSKPMDAFFLLSTMMMGTPGNFGKREVEIIESDAGQKTIDDMVRSRRLENARKQAEINKAFLEEQKKYASLGRNDRCICGSGKKYKHCCLSKYG